MKTVLCLGDSITEGAGSSMAGFCYVSELQALLGGGWEVLNFGRSGATVTAPPNGHRDQYSTLPHFACAKRAAKAATRRGDTIFITVLLGTNDADVLDYGYPTEAAAFEADVREAFIRDYLALLTAMRQAAPAAHFLLCKSPYSYDNQKHKNFGNLPAVWAMQDEIFALCRARQLPFTVLDLAEVTSPARIGSKGVTQLFADGLHPNDTGHLRLAYRFRDALLHADDLV